jgi:hypothetical protein
MARNVNASIDYYDEEAVISLHIMLTNDSVENLNKICTYLNIYLNMLSEMDISLFTDIYENFRKTNLLRSLYDNQTNSIDVTNGVVDNLIKGSKSHKCYSIIRKYLVPEFTDGIYTQFANLFDNFELKITTNLHMDGSAKSSAKSSTKSSEKSSAKSSEKSSEKSSTKSTYQFITSKYYNTKYYMTNLLMDTSNKMEVDYDISNIIGFKDIVIKLDVINTSIDKNKIPILISKSDSKDVYLLPYNKYEKPICNITVIRKNSSYIDNKNKIIMSIYKSLCLKILNYYLDTIQNFKMHFSISMHDDYLIMNYNGLDYIMNKFINEINKKITFFACISNPNSSKYFENIKRDMKENLLNIKYNSPYQLCMSYFSIILSNGLMPDDAIKYIDSLTYDDFKINLDKLLNFEKEYFILIGNFQKCSQIFNDMDNDDTHKNALEIVDILSLNQFRFTKNIEFDNGNNSIPTFNYLLTKDQINHKEVNNCVIDFYLVKDFNLKLNLDKDTIELEQLKEILRYSIIFTIIADIINEPLFDKIRTIDKLGYIVKCIFKPHTYNNKCNMFLCYMIQSAHDIDEIYKSINDFNTGFYKDFKTNDKKFNQIFSTLKKSKLLEYGKLPSDIDEESYVYFNAIVNKYGIFTIDKLSYDILNSITFSDLKKQLEDVFDHRIKSNRYHIIVDKTVNTN